MDNRCENSDVNPNKENENHVRDDNEDEFVELTPEQQSKLLGFSAEDIKGMIFPSEPAAYNFYNAYAKVHGFSARKDDIVRDEDGRMCARQYCCSKEGFRNKKRLVADKKKGHRPLTRVNCKAKLRIRIDYRTSNWKVVSFVETHNHNLCPENFVPFIPKYRGLSEADKAQVNNLRAQGVKTCQILGFLMAQKGGCGGLGFIKKDLYNHIEREKRAMIVGGDSKAALDYLQGKADSDAMFYASCSSVFTSPESFKL